MMSLRRMKRRKRKRRRLRQLKKVVKRVKMIKRKRNPVRKVKMKSIRMTRIRNQQAHLTLLRRVKAQCIRKKTYKIQQISRKNHPLTKAHSKKIYQALDLEKPVLILKLITVIPMLARAGLTGHHLAVVSNLNSQVIGLVSNLHHLVKPSNNNNSSKTPMIQSKIQVICILIYPNRIKGLFLIWLHLGPSLVQMTLSMIQYHNNNHHNHNNSNNSNNHTPKCLDLHNHNRLMFNNHK